MKDTKITSGHFPKGEETTLYEMKVDYIQDGDTCSSNELNTLTIKSQNGGAGTYYIFKTKRFPRKGH